MLEQTRKLYEIFNEEQKNKINLIIREIENQGSNYKTNKLWITTTTKDSIDN